jgi:hypothetical protein
MLQLSMEMNTDFVTARTLNTIRRGVNVFAGQSEIVGRIVPTKFTKSIFYDLPGIALPRSAKYTRRKLLKYGTDLPNVRTGQLRRDMPATAKVTATANGGRVLLRVYFAGKLKGARLVNGKWVGARQGLSERHRQEFENIGSRQRDRLAKAVEREFVRQINDPAHRRKRAVKRKG